MLVTNLKIFKRDNDTLVHLRGFNNHKNIDDVEFIIPNELADAIREYWRGVESDKALCVTWLSKYTEHPLELLIIDRLPGIGYESFVIRLEKHINLHTNEKDWIQD